MRSKSMKRLHDAFKIVTSRVVKKMYYITHIAGRPGKFLNLAGTPIRRGQLSPLLEMKNQQKG